VTEHRFDGDALARSYVDLARRGHLRGTRAQELVETADAWLGQGNVPAADELRSLAERLPGLADRARATWRPREAIVPDYAGLAASHNARRRR
jgi:hypothetical protein